MKFNVGNAQHIGARQQQEDSFAFSDPGDRDAMGHGGFLGIVADGMGGLSNGQQASATAVQTFLQAYRAKSPAEPIVDALRRSLLEANSAVISLQAAGSSAESGTTLAAAVVTKEHLHWIAAGDSRIYSLRNNQLVRLTADHVYATRLDRQVALGQLSREIAQHDPQRGSLTSYLGQPGPTLIDYNLKPLTLHQDESIILCSDGFYRAVSEEEIVAHFSADPQTACDRLVELVLAKQRKQQDNLTVIAFRARAGKPRFSHLGKVLLLAMIPIVLVLAAGAYWLRFHYFVNNQPAAAAPAAKSQQPPPSAPVTVSRPPAAPSQEPSDPDKTPPQAKASPSGPKAVAQHDTREVKQTPSTKTAPGASAVAQPKNTTATPAALPAAAPPTQPADDKPSTPVPQPAAGTRAAPEDPQIKDPPPAKPPTESTPPAGAAAPPSTSLPRPQAHIESSSSLPVEG